MATARFIARRILAAVPLLFVVSALTFVLVSLVPGDPARVILGEHATAAEYAQVRRQLGLDEPIQVQYWHWLTALLHGNLGSSLFSGEPVTQALNASLPATLSLILASTLVTGAAGIVLGIVSARRGGALGRVIDALAMIGLAVPSFWLALVLIELFAVRLRLFPVIGYTPLSSGVGPWARSLVLPVAAVSLGFVAIIAKQARDSVLDASAQEFVRVMRANGFSPRSILYRHILRNAAIPVTTVLGVLMVSLVGALVFVETVFAMPGIAGLTQQATVDHDIPIIQGAVLYITVFVVLVNLLVDLTYRWLDPRVRVA
jgi:peptide/nickel transport system permease protein